MNCHRYPSLVAYGLLAGLAVSSAANAQSVQLGRQAAERLCAQCHAFEGQLPPVGSPVPPPLAAVANLPSTTELSLRAFLYTPHLKMPNLMLTPGEVADIIAFILSMRER